MWDNLVRMVKNDEKDALIKNCMNRGIQAFNTIYTIEEMTMGSFWRNDYRYYENSIAVLYERYCYAMSMIVNQFCVKYETLHGRYEAYRSGITFLAAMNQCTDTIFELQTDGKGFKNGVIFYHDENYMDDDYDEFWEEHCEEKNQILRVREAFRVEEKKWKFGFHPKYETYDEAQQTDNEDDEEQQMNSEDFPCEPQQTDNKDFLHIQKIIGMGGEVDAEKFLTITKREYLPMIIDAFIQEPRTDMFPGFNS